MILTQTVRITPNNSNKARYKELGYVFNDGDAIDVKVTDLPWSSNLKIRVKCDEPDCEAEKEISYYSYNLTVRKNGFYRCYQCGCKEKERVFLEKYGVRNPMMLPEIHQKAINTTLERHGYRYTFEKEDFQEVKKQACLEKFGVEHQMKSQEIKDKAVQTNLERYGVMYGAQTEEVRGKMQKTCLERYGVEHAMQSATVLAKRNITNNERYGGNSPTNDPIVRQKQKDTCLKRYGFENPMQNEEVVHKVLQTMYEHQSQQTSTQQKYLCELYGGKLNYPMLRYSADIMTDDRIDIEYDGGGHKFGAIINAISEDELEKLEIIRNDQFKRNGYKVMRIISKKDKLPHDDILLKMLADAREYYEEYPNHSWVEYDIDKSVVRNAENKDGLPYLFGELRKIRSNDMSQ